MGRNRVYPDMRTITAVLGAAAALLTVAGCAKPGGSQAGAPDSAFEKRAAQVADAWRPGDALTAWRKGFVPLQDLTVAPQSGGTRDDTRTALVSGWFRLAITIPDRAAAKGKIRFG